jgi:hypothetical protein
MRISRKFLRIVTLTAILVAPVGCGRMRPEPGWLCSPWSRETACITCIVRERSVGLPMDAMATVCPGSVTLDDMPTIGRDETTL